MKKIIIIILLLVFVLFVSTGIYFYNVIAKIDDVKTSKYNLKPPASITVPLNKLVLIRSGNKIGAFKILYKVSRWRFLNGVKYEYWYQGDGTGDFTKENVLHGNGIVYEKYIDEGNKLKDAGSRLNVKVGPLWVEWSDGNHIYTDYYSTEKEELLIKNIEITATQWENIKEVNLSSTELKWINKEIPSNESLQWTAGHKALVTPTALSLPR